MKVNKFNNFKWEFGVVHAMIECEDCDWKSKNYKNAQACAKVHANKYKHRVRGDLGYIKNPALKDGVFR